MTYTATIQKKDGTTEKVIAPDRTHYFHCDRCNLDKTHISDFTTGYGTLPNGEIRCFDCCALEDIDQMKKTGQIVLYLTMRDKMKEIKSDPGVLRSRPWMIPDKLTNWPGSLTFEILSWSKGRHNWGIDRYDLWFKGPDDLIWYGRFQGSWTQLTYCKRTKHTGYAGAVANYHGLTL
jgi:hypothetical protein